MPCQMMNQESSPARSSSASFFLIPAFSISSMRTIGESLITAMSAVISALDWPPLRIVRWWPGWTGSPVRVFASSITRSTTSGDLPRLLACIRRNSSTDMSARKCMF